jgi:hypothetical protein
MYNNTPPRIVVISVSLTGCLVGLAFVLSWSAYAQSTCCTPPTLSPSAARWHQNSAVTVRISNTFTNEEREDIIAGFQAWNSENANNGSGVTFTTLEIGEAEATSNSPNTQFVGYNPNLAVAGVNVVEGATLQNGEQRVFANMYLSDAMRNPNMTTEIRRAFTRGLSRHETGHGFGLENATNCPAGSSVMAQVNTSTVITPCDNAVVRTLYPTCDCGDCENGCCVPGFLACETPTPTPEPTEGPCDQFGEGWFIGIDGKTCVPPECADCYAAGGSHCPPCWTPILIDTEGNGFNMSSARDGVQFRPDVNLEKIKTAWTSATSDDAWLVLDRNLNGEIDDATELFSCAAPQAKPERGIGNGFRALAEFDKPEKGGNSDKKIDLADQVFNRLHLWRDLNHNGVSEPTELQPLEYSQVGSIELQYRESRRQDRHGNKFRFRAVVRGKDGFQVGRWAYDVFPTVER